jgi:outer membrane protein assembly factor BamB
MPRLAGVVLLAALLPAPAAPETAAAKPFDWPQWRGPNRDAVYTETGLLQQWPRNGPPLVWKQKGLGGGFSTPSVAAGRIYGLSYQGNDEVIWARDEATGKPVWTTRIAAKSSVWPAEGSRSSPIVAGGRVYAVGTGGDLACLDAASGKRLWSKNYTRDFNGQMMSGWGFSESVLVDGDKVIGTPGADNAALVALDAANGKVIWKAAIPDCGGAGYSSVMPVEANGVRMYVTVLGQKVVGVAAKDGKLVWEGERPCGGTANIPTVIVKDNRVLASTGYTDGGTTLYEISNTRSGWTARQVWDLPANVARNHHGGMVRVGDYVYFGHGQNAGKPICLEFATGRVAWKAGRGPAEGSAAVVYADGRLIFRYDDGTVALIEASPKAYRLVSSFKQPDRSPANAWAHPVIANGKLYLRDQDVLLCYDLKAKG